MCSEPSLSPDCHGWRRPGRTLLPLSPLILPMGLLFLGGLALALAQSLGFWLPVSHQGELLDAYKAALAPHYLASMAFSLTIAFVSAGLSVAFGTLGAWAMWNMPPLLQRASMIYKMGLILPHMAVAFVVLILWSRTGFISAIAFHMGLVDDPGQFPAILHSGNGAGMIIAFVAKETPFAMLLALAVLARTDRRLVQVARMLGAGPVRIFVSVVLPRLTPALHTAFIILFLYTLGAFDIPFLLAESRPGMLSIEIYNLYFKRELTDRPTAMALLVVLFVFSVAFIMVYSHVASRLEDRVRKL
ncbi:ABC transporter permease [Pseudodesulfovibrio pelocollis]|uniref:ABC transporter permease n=1 Tax=Pseudodesulfovibrio pelocollis TaxID=3051432 RepID=UPI00255AE7B8|nr:ABC transporter permease subunit [Pseudodesulfovibrio sp. SB368]